MDTNERKIKKKGLGNGGIRPRPFLIAMFVVLATAALTLSACTRSMSVEALPTTPTTIAGTAWPKSTPTQTSSRYAPIQVTVSPNAEGYNIKINSELLVPANTWIFLVTKRGNETWVLLNSRTNYNWTLKWSFQTSEVMDIFDGRKLQSGYHCSCHFPVGQEVLP